MASSPEKVLKDLQKENFATIYFLQGEEPFYVDLISDYLEKNVVPEHEKGFNQVVLYGKDTDIRTILNYCRKYPMMGNRQLILVKEAQDISDLGKDEAQQILESYLKNPLPSTILALCHKHKTLKKSTKLYKSLDNHGVVVNSAKLYDNQIPDWIRQYVSSKGHHINEKAVQILSENIGNNLEKISNEINKILVNFKGKIHIDEQIIDKYVGINRDYNIFEFQKALSGRDILKANKIINYFAANPREHPVIFLLTMLYSYYSKLLLVHQHKQKPEKELASLTGISPFFLKEYLLAARNFPIKKIVENIHYLREADLISKGVDSGKFSEKELLQELTFKLLH
jgi:DNA polymerase-3 subunit delta